MELELEGVKLKVYESGEVHRLYKKGWILCKGTITKHGYKRIQIYGKCIQVHRIVYKAFNPDWDMDDTKQYVDHRNRIKNDNRICNLRVGTSQQNQQNTNTKGYCWCNTWKRWIARIQIHNASRTIKCKTEEEAIEAVKELRAKYFEFYERTEIPEGE